MFDTAPSRPLSQGDVVVGLSAHGYEDLQTFGIVVTARCDLAQSKADVINYVPAVPLREWFERGGWRGPASEEETSTSAQLRAATIKCLRKSDVGEGAISVAIDEYGGTGTVSLIRDQGIDVPPKVHELADRLDVLRTALRSGSRPPNIHVKLVKRLLSDLQAHKVADLYYLPFNFLGENEPANAHVALLRQIYALPGTSLTPVPGVACVQLDTEATQLPPRSASTDLPFGRVARMRSPYTEHFLQRATLLFARVGVDDIRFQNIEELVEVIR